MKQHANVRRNRNRDRVVAGGRLPGNDHVIIEFMQSYRTLQFRQGEVDFGRGALSFVGRVRGVFGEDGIPKTYCMHINAVLELGKSETKTMSKNASFEEERNNSKSSHEVRKGLKSTQKDGQSSRERNRNY